MWETKTTPIQVGRVCSWIYHNQPMKTPILVQLTHTSWDDDRLGEHILSGYIRKQKLVESPLFLFISPCAIPNKGTFYKVDPESKSRCISVNDVFFFEPCTKAVILHRNAQGFCTWGPALSQTLGQFYGSVCCLYRLQGRMHKFTKPQTDSGIGWVAQPIVPGITVISMVFWELRFWDFHESQWDMVVEPKTKTARWL